MSAGKWFKLTYLKDTREGNSEGLAAILKEKMIQDSPGLIDYLVLSLVSLY
jgi:hypothetical protein